MAKRSIGEPSPQTSALPAAEAIVRRALEWATGQVGSTTYALRCLAFVEDAYEVANDIEIFGGSSARESAEIYGAAPTAGGPEPGAFVFFDTSGMVDGVRRDWGHVGLAIGAGRMVHAWPEIRIDAIAEVPLLPTGGWTPPRLIGWASPRVILRGARRVLRCMPTSA